MLISVVEIDPDPPPPVIVTLGPVAFQGDATMTADVRTSKVTLGTVSFQGDADMVARVNVESRMKAFMQGDATMEASVSNSKYITGDRTASIQVKSTAALNGGGTRYEVLPNMVNGSFADSGLGSIIFTAGQSGREMTFDFRPSGFMQAVDEIKWYQDVAAGHGGWRVEAWDGETWTVLNAGFTLGTPATQIIPLNNSKPYFVYRMIQQSGTTSATPFIREVEFKQQQGPAITAVDAGAKYTYAGGIGDRRSNITVTTTFTLDAGFPSAAVTTLVDGSTATLGPFVVMTAGQSGKEFKFDFGTLGKQIIDEFRIFHGNGFDTGYFRMQGLKNDGVTWQDIGTWFLLAGVGGGGFRTYNNIVGNLAGFSKYRLVQLDTSTNTGGLHTEIEFKIDPAIAADMVGDADLVDDTISVNHDTGEAGACGSTSYDNPDGKGNRAAFITITNSAGLINQGTIGELIDSVIHTTSGNLKFNAVTDGKITFDFGSARIIDGFIWWQAGSTAHGTWRWYGSNDSDPASFIATGNSFTLEGPGLLGGAGKEILEPAGNTTAYRYWQLRQLSGTAGAALLAEIWFRIGCSREFHPVAAMQGDATMTANVTVTDASALLITDETNGQLLITDEANGYLQITNE